MLSTLSEVMAAGPDLFLECAHHMRPGASLIADSFSAEESNGVRGSRHVSAYKISI